MTRGPRSRRWIAAIALALATAATGCQTKTPVGPTAGEDTLSRGKGGKVLTPTGGTVQGRALRLTGRDGKAIDGVYVRIGGRTLLARDGVVQVPEDAWTAAQKAGKLVVIGAGFLPLSVPLDGGLPAELVLTPTADMGEAGVVSLDGGTLAAANDQAMVTIPTGFLTAGDTPITVGTYQPTIGADAQAVFERDVAAFLAARAQAAGQPAPTEGACGAPFVCGPVTDGLGVAITVDGPIQAGQVSVSIDLAKNDSPAAARILETFRNFDATNDPTYRTTMRDQYGITLDGTMLTFPVKLGDVADVDGLARVEVDGLSVLGARLEVTVTSAAGAARAGALSEAVPIVPGDVPLSLIRSKLPDYVEPTRLQTAGGAVAVDNGPDAIFSLVANNGGQLTIRDDDAPTTFTAAQLLTNNGGALISNVTGGVALISDHSSGLVSNNSGGLISNNSGGLISNNSGGLISNNSGGVVSQNGAGFVANNAGGLVAVGAAGLIANNSGGLVSNNSGGLIGNNAGGFKTPTITGYPFFPFEPAAGKYQLLQLGPPVPEPVRETVTGLTEYLWPGQTRVRAIMANGAPLTDWTKTGGSGEFVLELPKDVPIVFFLQAELLVRGTDNKPRMAYSLAFAPGKKGTTSVFVDASTTMVTTSTLHLLDYIPPEYQRLSGLAEDFEKKVKDVVASLPEGVDLNEVAGGGSGNGKGNGAAVDTGNRQAAQYQLRQAGAPSPSPTTDPKVAAAKKAIADMQARLSFVSGRLEELEGAWGAFNPFLFGQDLGSADRTIDTSTAQAISTAASLRGAYDPMYGFATQDRFVPESYEAINPDSPPETYAF